jgi:hypothetical protein
LRVGYRIQPTLYLGDGTVVVGEDNGVEDERGGKKVKCLPHLCPHPWLTENRKLLIENEGRKEPFSINYSFHSL